MWILSLVLSFTFPVKTLMEFHSLTNFNGSSPLTPEARDRLTHPTEMAHNTSGWSHWTAVQCRSGQRGLGSYLLSVRGDFPLQRVCRSRQMWERRQCQGEGAKVQGLTSLDWNKRLKTKDASMLCCEKQGRDPQPNRIYFAPRMGRFYSCVNRKLHPNCWPCWVVGLAKIGTSNRLVFERKVCPQWHFRARWSNFKHPHQSV